MVELEKALVIAVSEGQGRLVETASDELGGTVAVLPDTGMVTVTQTPGG